MKHFDVTALGEVLIDFTPGGLSPAGQLLFERNAGGGPANVAAACARLGAKTAFIGKTGTDAFGSYLEETLAGIGIETRGMRKCADQHTTLAFVNLTPEGERSFSFCRNPGADTQLSADELDSSILHDTFFFHVSSLSLTHEPAASATYEAVREAKKAGAYISYDPNWRAPLWKNRAEGIKKMASLFDFADVIKLSDEEVPLFFNSKDYAACAQTLLNGGASVVLITLGPKGVFYKTDKFQGLVPTIPVTVVDTTGAGDSFLGGFLYRLSRNRANDCSSAVLSAADAFKKPQKEFEADLLYANAVASLCVSKKGAIPAMPSADEVANFL